MGVSAWPAEHRNRFVLKVVTDHRICYMYILEQDVSKLLVLEISPLN